MTSRLQIFLVIGIGIFTSMLIRCLIKKRMNLKYCLIWLGGIAIMLLAALCPQLVRILSRIVGIKTPINTVFVIYGFLMLLIVFSLTAIVSHLNVRVVRLVQNQALLEARIRSLESSLDAQGDTTKEEAFKADGTGI